MSSKPGICTVISGDNASGKTSYAQKLSRELTNVRFISFKDSYGGALDREYFSQQRWNQGLMELEFPIPTVRELLNRISNVPGLSSEELNSFRDTLYESFGIYDFLDKKIIMLSSGELRKYQLTKALLTKPETIIIDNPFIGLDMEMRNLLEGFLKEMLDSGINLYLIISRRSEIPDFVNKKITLCHSEHSEEALPLCKSERSEESRCKIIEMNNVTVRYGGRKIIDSLNWVVHKGDFWALTGRNGSGKTTLLSLITGDNPQRYSNDIRLFGQGNRSGLSIWDIKKRIGEISPEMHRAFNEDISVERLIGQGEKEAALMWMESFGISHLKGRSFLRISSGEQRLALLARAFVKDPELLILDEPFHGLDDPNRALVKNIITSFYNREGKTIIMVSHYQEDFPDCITNTLKL